MKKFLVLPIIIIFAIFLQGSVNDPLDPSFNAIKHNSKGMWHARWGNYYAAIEEYKIAIGLNPETAVSSSFYNNLGQVYMQVEKPGWAITCFENAIRLNPNCMFYYDNLIDGYFENKEIDNQEKIFLRKVDVSFEDSYNWLILGLIQEKKKDYVKAVKSFNNYLLLEPEIVLRSAVKNKTEKMLKELSI